MECRPPPWRPKKAQNWSVTAWQRWDGAALRPIWGSDCGSLVPERGSDNAAVGCIELYAHDGDDGMAPGAFDDFENVNLAKDPAHAATLAILLAQLRFEVERWITPNPPAQKQK